MKPDPAPAPIQYSLLRAGFYVRGNPPGAWRGTGCGHDRDSFAERGVVEI
jgi:hypothetical protein